MLRSELIAAIARAEPHLDAKDAERLVTVIFDEITNTLAQGGRVELRGFGSFSERARDGRVGRNPRTGASVQVDAKRVPHFKPGKKLREQLSQIITD